MKDDDAAAHEQEPDDAHERASEREAPHPPRRAPLRAPAPTTRAARPSFLRRNAVTLLLAGAAASLAFYVLVIDRKSPTTAEVERRKRNLLPMWRADELTEVTLTAKGATAKLTPKPDADAGILPWELELDGARHPAAELGVDQLLGTLEYAVFEREVRDPAVRAEAKLDAPSVTLSLTMSGQRYEVRVGGPAPSPPGARYVEVRGRGEPSLFVITRELAAALEVDPRTLRSRRLVPYLSPELSRIELSGKGGARKLVRAPWHAGRGGAFRFEGSAEHGSVRADADVFDKMLGALGGLESAAFLDDDEGSRALSPEVTLTLVPSDGRPAGVLSLGGACPKKVDGAPEGSLVVAMRTAPTKVAACVPKVILEGLSVSAERLVDRGALAARFDEVTEVRVVRGDSVVDLARSDTGFHLRKPSDRPVDADAGRELLERMLSVEGELVGKAPEAAPAGTVEVRSVAVGVEHDRVEKLEVWAPLDGKVLVRRAEDGAVLSLDQDRARDLFVTDTQLRERQVLSVGVKRVRALRVEQAGVGAPRVQRFERNEEGGYKLLEPEGRGLGPDLGLVSDVVSQLAGLRAVRWAGARDDGTFGLEKPRLVLELEVLGDDDKPSTHRLLMGATTEGGTFARLASDPFVLVAPRALETAADRWLLDRAALLVDEGSLGQVTLEHRDGKRLVLERKAGVLRPADGGDAGKGTLVSRALGELLAEQVVTLGPADKREGLDAPELSVSIEGLAEAGDKPRKTKLTFGVGDSLRGVSVIYARKAGLDATFAVAEGRVRPLRQALGLD